MSQYEHASWKISDGFSEGTIQSIAQTADGYLWLGTEFGLRRFDGVRDVPWKPPAGQHLPSGRLWIGTFSGLASWKDRELTQAYRVAGEALRNAIKHAHAQHIAVTIHYEPRQLRLVIRDDGNGIDEETMARQQVTSHFGLPGMRERAAIVNGQLDVRSERGAGTEIELRVPARTAYLARGASSSV